MSAAGRASGRVGDGRGGGDGFLVCRTAANSNPSVKTSASAGSVARSRARLDASAHRCHTCHAAQLPSTADTTSLAVAVTHCVVMGGTGTAAVVAAVTIELTPYSLTACGASTHHVARCSKMLRGPCLASRVSQRGLLRQFDRPTGVGGRP